MNAPRSPHQIRLRGPWTVYGPGAELPDSVPETIHLPAGWRTLFGEHAGRARFVRRFNRPTNLGDEERVCIVLADTGGAVTLHVNGESVESATGTDSAAMTFDITSRLQPHNELEIEIEFDPLQHPDAAGGLWRPVTIEIRC
jgi:hypothetical protein